MHKNTNKQKYLNQSTHQLPYENLLLWDLPGEEWRPLPFEPFDAHYMVSNKGRIKKRARVIIKKDGTRNYLPELIIKQSVHHRYNHYLEHEVYTLRFGVAFDGIKKNFSTCRIVYYIFISPFDLSDPDLIVRFKDGNGLNPAVDNIYISTRKEPSQPIVNNDFRSRLVEVCDQKNSSKEEIQQERDLKKKSVSQYDPKGRLREGVNNPTQMEAIEPKQISYPHRGSKRVAKYSLQGDLLAVYPSMSKAARDSNLNSGTLHDRLHKHIQPKDFIWKTVEEFQEPPAKIEVVPFVPVKSIRKKPDQPAKPYTYPYQNRSLEDMPGEVWIAIPDTNENYFASNYGRIKSIDRIIERNKIKLWYGARIIHQSAQLNKKGRLKGLVTHFITPERRFNFQVPHLIYKLFNGEIPPKYTIKFKDNDPYNCRAENLTIQPLSNCYRPYFEQRRLLYEQNCKRFAQFTREGELVAIYKSIYEAAEKSGFEKDKLSECAKGIRKTIKGFFWKFIEPDEVVG